MGIPRDPPARGGHGVPGRGVMCELVRSTFFKIRILLRTETGQFLISQDVRSESRPAAAESDLEQVQLDR